ncbi:MAG: MerR family transcriptional regulator [Dehalococcoidia bacterium]|nr:MerR family transcriptional regulator [Dehalococcoidia bacterium]
MTLKIGEVSHRSGLPSSTLRYYESIGLLDPPPRVSGRRVYNEAALDRLRVIALAQSVGFSLAQIGVLLDGFPAGTPASERWRASTRSKIEELEAQATDIERMLGLLRHLETDCRCTDLGECAAGWARKGT